MLPIVVFIQLILILKQNVRRLIVVFVYLFVIVPVAVVVVRFCPSFNEKKQTILIHFFCSFYMFVYATGSLDGIHVPRWIQHFVRGMKLFCFLYLDLALFSYLSSVLLSTLPASCHTKSNSVFDLYIRCSIVRSNHFLNSDTMNTDDVNNIKNIKS